jgi:hypothetical protein
MWWVLWKCVFAIVAGTATAMAIVASEFNIDHPNHVYRLCHSRLPGSWGSLAPLYLFSFCHVLLYPWDKLRSKPTSYNPRGVSIAYHYWIQYFLVWIQKPAWCVWHKAESYHTEHHWEHWYEHFNEEDQELSSSQDVFRDNPWLARNWTM